MQKLKLNDEVIKNPSKKVITGDKLSLKIPEPEKASLKPYNFKLEIMLDCFFCGARFFSV